MADSVPDPGVLEERVAGLAEVVNKLIGVVSRLDDETSDTAAAAFDSDVPRVAGHKATAEELKSLRAALWMPGLKSGAPAAPVSATRRLAALDEKQCFGDPLSQLRHKPCTLCGTQASSPRNTANCPPVDAAIIVALIALVGTIGNASLTYGLQRRRELKKSDAIWARYRASLASAAEDLSNRIENILRGDFLDAFVGGPNEDQAVQSTLFRFAQYFGWSEVVRRYMRSPDPRHAREDQKLEELRRLVAHTFSSDRYGPYGSGGFTMWREAQRAVGELMITRDGDVIDTIGVADFVVAIKRVRPWMSDMEQLIRTSPSNWGQGDRERLQQLQAVLGEVANEVRSTSTLAGPAVA